MPYVILDLLALRTSYHLAVITIFLIFQDKMLFCDLCDRGYHIYCVGLDEIPVGRWHCTECSQCSMCGERDPMGGEKLSDMHHSMRNKKIEWVFEYKTGSNGGKIYSHTMCIPCHR